MPWIGLLISSPCGKVCIKYIKLFSQYFAFIRKHHYSGHTGWRRYSYRMKGIFRAYRVKGIFIQDEGHINTGWRAHSYRMKGIFIQDEGHIHTGWRAHCRNVFSYKYKILAKYLEIFYTYFSAKMRHLTSQFTEFINIIPLVIFDNKFIRNADLCYKILHLDIDNPLVYTFNNMPCY